MVGTTHCGNCGTNLEESSNLKEEERKPCPSCGSVARSFRLIVESGVYTISGATVAFMVAKPPEGLLLKTVIVPGNKTTEGQLIEAVAVPWFEIVTLLTKDPTAMYQIDPRKWEEIIAGAYKKAGFERVTLTPRSGDYGRDVIAEKEGVGFVRVIDQVKAYGPGHLVTADDVRALMGVLLCDSASKGFLTTTSNFAPRLTEDPLIRPLIPSRLGLINGEELIRRLGEIAKKYKA